MAEIIIKITDKPDGSFDVLASGDTSKVETDGQIFTQMIMAIAQAAKEGIEGNTINSVENIGT